MSEMIKQLNVPLFVPGHRVELLPKAAASGADAVIMDLEDAVAEADKPAAHINIGNRPDLPVPLVVRVNAGDTEWFARDLAVLAKNPPAMQRSPLSDQ